MAAGSATVSAQTVNTQVGGLTLTNGLSSVTDAAAITSTTNTANLATGIGYLTDNSVLTGVWNFGFNTTGLTFQGTFGGTISSQADAIYFVGIAQSTGGTETATARNGAFNLQLELTTGLTAARSYSDINYIVTSQEITNSLGVYFTGPGFVANPYNPGANKFFLAYLKVPFSDFGATYDKIVGVRVSNVAAYWPDIGYVGVGFGGTAVPEPSTYGLALGGLALAGAVIRRRRSK